MYRYGILSTASIVSRFVDGIRDSKKGQVYAIASRTEEKAREVAKKLQVDVSYGTYEELLEDEHVDIVYIPTVNGRHYHDCKNALLHHKHVLVEKPFCLTSKDARELFSLAKQQGCFLMEAQKAVFLPVTQKIKEIVHSGILGDISYIELKAGFPHRFDYDHWMYNLSMGGGSLYGSATYTVEYLQYLFDDPCMEVNGTFVPCLTGSDEICHFHLNLNQNMIVASTIAMNVPLQNEAVFYGEKGYIVVPEYWKARECHLYLYNGEHQVFEFPCHSEFVYEINHVHDCLDQQKLQSPIMSEERTIQTIEIVERLYQQWMK